MSDHGFGPIEWYVNFNVWLLERGDIALAGLVLRPAEAVVLRPGRDPRVVLQPDGPARPGRAAGRAGSGASRRAGSSGWRESAFLSRRHIDWSRTKAYAQGNFGQIFLNLKGRQPQGCVDPEDVRPLLDDLKAGLLAIPHPETGEPLVEQVYERDELYHGPHAHLAPDLTVVLGDWRYRTIGLHDFTTNQLISPAFGPTGDHRMEGVLIASGPAVPPGATPRGRQPARHRPDGPPPARRPRPRRHGRPRPDRDPRPGRRRRPRPARAAVGGRRRPSRSPSAYTEEEDAAIQQRLADLGYL